MTLAAAVGASGLNAARRRPLWKRSANERLICDKWTDGNKLEKVSEKWKTMNARQGKGLISANAPDQTGEKEKPPYASLIEK